MDLSNASYSVCRVDLKQIKVLCNIYYAWQNVNILVLISGNKKRSMPALKFWKNEKKKQLDEEIYCINTDTDRNHLHFI